MSYQEQIDALGAIIRTSGHPSHDLITRVSALIVAKEADEDIADYESRIAAFRDAIDEANRRMDAQEATITRLTAERDAAKAQAESFYQATQEAQSERDAAREERDGLRDVLVNLARSVHLDLDSDFTCTHPALYQALKEADAAIAKETK